jgi:plasmid stabilization system protein ParE
METCYDVSAEAQNDLFEIWERIADDSVTLANRIDDEFHGLFASPGRMPGQDTPGGSHAPSCVVLP